MKNTLLYLCHFFIPKNSLFGQNIPFWGNYFSSFLVFNKFSGDPVKLTCFHFLQKHTVSCAIQILFGRYRSVISMFHGNLDSFMHPCFMTFVPVSISKIHVRLE